MAEAAVPGPYSPPTSDLMARAAVSHEEFMRRNPTKRQAEQGPDWKEWKASDDREREQLTTPQEGRIGPVMQEIRRSEVPEGQVILPITKQRKIKGNGTYKTRWCVMGNLDDFNGPTYASTAAKKVVWLLFALTTRLGLHTRFFDITGAFMHERPTRDIYVSVDHKFYKLLYSLYGTKDAPKLFQDGLVVHLTSGGYIQSRWDQCLFYKWISILIFIYIIFHVDDLDAAGTSEEILDEFEVHMKKKYEVTSNTDGVFLGIAIQSHGLEATIFRRPIMLQNIFDTYLPQGPTKPPPRGPIQLSYLKAFDKDDSPPISATEFRSMLGMIQQMMDVRPDICFAVVKLAQRQASPRAKDADALLHLIHYLYATRSHGVVLRRRNRCMAGLLVHLRAYTDCSFACHGNGKSHYGFCFDLVDDTDALTWDSSTYTYDPTLYGEDGPLMDTGMFYSKSIMAPTVDLVTCEGEMGSTIECTKDIILFRGILQELHQQQMRATPVFGDNDSTIRLGSNYNGNHKRVRYMLPKVNWLMDMVKAGVVQLFRMGTKKLPPDTLTKASSGSDWEDKIATMSGSKLGTHVVTFFIGNVMYTAVRKP